MTTTETVPRLKRFLVFSVEAISDLRGGGLDDVSGDFDVADWALEFAAKEANRFQETYSGGDVYVFDCNDRRRIWEMTTQGRSGGREVVPLRISGFASADKIPGATATLSFETGPKEP